MGAMAGILFFGIIPGIVIGVVLSLLLLIARASRPGCPPARPAIRTPTPTSISSAIPDLETTPGVLVVRIDGPLFFADATASAIGCAS